MKQFLKRKSTFVIYVTILILFAQVFTPKSEYDIPYCAANVTTDCIVDDSGLMSGMIIVIGILSFLIMFLLEEFFKRRNR